MTYPILNPEDFRNETFTEESNEQNAQVVAEKLSKLVRGSKGLPIDPEEQIRYLIDIKKDQERTRFPTYPIMEWNDYLRLAHVIYGDCAKSCDKLAKLESSSLISYKGKSREEFVDISKKSTQEGQEINIGRLREEIQKKKRFWQREKKEKTEFENK